MGKLGNYILNVFLSFVLLFVAIFFFTAEHYFVALVILLALLVYLLLCDIYFPSIGNIKNFAFTEKDIRKKTFDKNILSFFVHSNCFSCWAHKRLHFAAFQFACWLGHNMFADKKEKILLLPLRC